MKEYIEREDLLEEVNDAISNIAFTSPCQDEIYPMIEGMERIRDMVEEALAADVEPVIHGEWKFLGDNYAKCTNCERLFEALPNTFAFEANNLYCRFCGAKMDGANKSLPFGIQRPAEEVGSALKELYNNLSRCHKCIYETQCSKDKDYDRNCPIYKRDPKDGGYYG